MVLHALLLLLLGISLTGGMQSGIIGGQVAKPHSRPYMASIQIRKHHTCGGMLIKENYVLTAAHCLKDCYGQDCFEVVLGAHSLSPKRKEKSQQRIPVIKNIPHPMFQHNGKKDYGYDIMLLKLKHKATINKFVQVKPLPKKSETTNVKCSVAGWGSITPDGNEPTHVMREVTLKLQENSICKYWWQNYFDSDRNICSVSDGIHAFCKGDSGSPLICKNTPQGITSYTIDDDCTNTTYPQIYVKIFPFLNWIKNNMK